MFFADPAEATIYAGFEHHHDARRRPEWQTVDHAVLRGDRLPLQLGHPCDVAKVERPDVESQSGILKLMGIASVLHRLVQVGLACQLATQERAIGGDHFLAAVSITKSPAGRTLGNPPPRG